MDMLGGLTANEFLRDYWQKKPLVIRQAFPGFQCPVSQDELAGLAGGRQDELPSERMHFRSQQRVSELVLT